MLEEILTKVFAHYGEINSVKIMWPRSEEERARNRNTGFVSFKRRADADAARVSHLRSLFSVSCMLNVTLSHRRENWIKVFLPDTNSSLVGGKQ